MFHLAKENGHIRELPHFPMLKAPTPRKGVLDQEKYPLLLASLPEYLQPVLAIGYHTGMRLGEIQRLRWEQVDFLDRIIRLNAGETKNEEVREIPISDELYSILPKARGVPARLQPERATNWRLPAYLVRSLLETRPWRA